MSTNNQASPQTTTPSAILLSDPLRDPVEHLVSAHIDRTWRVRQFSDLIDLASHRCAILSDGAYSVFVKLSEATNGLHQFEVEMDGLRFLSTHAGVMIPTPIGILNTERGVLMVMEAAQAVERGEREWRQIGRTLAQIHQVKGVFCGFEQQGYFGPLYQDNRPMDDWLSFYTERRLWPGLMCAINSGHLSTTTINQVEKLVSRLPGLDIPDCQPTLLHGDAQQNNYISTQTGALVIDPAVFFGNPEFDLAHLETFQEVPEEVFLGYQESMPIDPGFYQRRELWRVAVFLLCVATEGSSYLPKLTSAVQKYL